jgi:hypothetical protein
MLDYIDYLTQSTYATVGAKCFSNDPFQAVVRAYWEYITPYMDLAYGLEKSNSPAPDKSE